MEDKKEKKYRIPYFIETRTTNQWSPASQEIANKCIEEINKAKTYDEKQKIANNFKKWIENSPEIQF